MSYLLDTNIISELWKPVCDINVKNFIENIKTDDFFISVLTIGEILNGIEKATTKKDKLLDDFNNLKTIYNDNILNIDIGVIEIWGNIKANSRTLPIIDSLIAATAISNNLILLTRNVRDFENIK
jgi:predicted nucleic acid-binding protein